MLALGGFRGLIASASLKHFFLLVQISRRIEIPRLDCLGLIEARTDNGYVYEKTRFRGLIASASLKPLHRSA